MSLHSARWLALSYFTYYFTFGIYLPFWALWLADKGYSTESIGLLLGIGMVARFSGNLYITSQVRQPGSLLTMMRVLALLSLISAVGFAFDLNWLWLLLIMVLFNFISGPLAPLSDALAGIW
ncbi:MAG: MFS transporter, partial [Enterobacteriaceae bacterium]